MSQFTSILRSHKWGRNSMSENYIHNGKVFYRVWHCKICDAMLEWHPNSKALYFGHINMGLPNQTFYDVGFRAESVGSKGRLEILKLTCKAIMMRNAFRN